MNEAIGAAGSGDAEALRDQRELTLQQLAEIGDVSVLTRPDGVVDVSIAGGRPLVIGTDTYTVEITDTPPAGLASISIGGADITSSFPRGRLAGALTARDSLIPGYQTRPRRARPRRGAGGQHAPPERVRSQRGGRRRVLHAARRRGRAAAALQLDAAVSADPALLAASGTGAPGDNTIARALSEPAARASSAAPPPSASWGQLEYRVGSDSQSARRAAEPARGRRAGGPPPRPGVGRLAGRGVREHAEAPARLRGERAVLLHRQLGARRSHGYRSPLMRVTFNNLNDGPGLPERGGQRLDRAQDQLATGKRVRTASDDPAAAQRAVSGRAEIARLDTFARTAQSAEARLTTVDTVLSGIIERITEAKSTTASVRGTTASAEGREAAARAIEGIRDSIVGAINTSVGGAYLFSGGQSLSPAYASSGGAWVYQGDNGAVQVDTGSDRQVTIALDGQAVLQGSDATSLLTDLDTLATAIRANDQTGIQAGLDAIDRAFNRATRAQSQVGVDLKGLEDDQLQISALRLAGQKRLSKDEDADLAKAASDMSRADTAYRAALSAISTAGRVSLMDYLR
ncbi:MAG: flagellin [Vicinamibacterales bacterium]